MCEKDRGSPLDKARQELKENKEKLKRDVLKGDSTICDFIKQLYERNLNFISAGVKTDFE